MAKPTKVLIIKTGYSETFTPEISDVVSLGDVFRTTALLHLYKGQHVTWLTAEKAIPLLQDNPYITELLPYNLTNVLKLQDEQFDIVINLEKVPGLCALGDRVRAWQRYGYRFDPRTGRAEAYLESTEALYIANNEDRKKESEKHWLELLFEMVGNHWNGECYVLGYTPRQLVCQHCIGFNHRVGNKFEGKGWSPDNWTALYHNLLQEEKFHIVMQPTETTIEDYIEWINSCKIIVSNDSLGIHLAMAMNKKIVGLFGPTPAKEMPPYKNAVWIQKEKMEDITIQEVTKAIKEIYGRV